jgi:hypothetical protein
MRKLLLASAAMLSASAGMANAQQVLGTPGIEQAAPPRVPQAGAGAVVSAPISAVGANNNNNISPKAIPGGTMNPEPGTFVVRLGGRVTVVGGAGWSNADNFSTPGSAAVAAVNTVIPGGAAVVVPAGSSITGISAAGAVTVTKPGTAAVAASRSKVQPQMLSSYARLYPGLDALTTNGLRYGAPWSPPLAF